MKKSLFFLLFSALVFLMICCGGKDSESRIPCEIGALYCYNPLPHEEYVSYGEYSARCHDSYEEYDWYIKFELCKDGCDPSSGKCNVWKDPDTNLIWSSLSDGKFKIYEEAKSYCDNLEETGYSDWHLPTISELRTLIQKCPATETGGTCGITDDCTSPECGDDSCNVLNDSICTTNDNKYYCEHSKLGDFGYLWSSSFKSSGLVYVVKFDKGFIRTCLPNNCQMGAVGFEDMPKVRCVRNAD
jgi:hypothetical protein